MKALFILINLAIAIISALAVYSFTHSIFWAAVGFFVLGGGASANPIIAFLALPAIEYFFGNGITWHSYTVIGLNAALLLLIPIFARNNG